VLSNFSLVAVGILVLVAILAVRQWRLRLEKLIREFENHVAQAEQNYQKGAHSTPYKLKTGA